ncbi:MAG TPA: YfhO family protein [Thermoanaerobaculia bacterium]|nr:YfhO family protein [Thermoanaerobaculia bacterium]
MFTILLESILVVTAIVAGAMLLTAALRRWIEPVPWRIAYLLLAVTLGFLGGDLWLSHLPVPLDEVMRGYPYRGVAGEVHPTNALTNDTVKLFLPWLKVAREEIFAGRAPLWNRYSFSGYPLLGNGESAPFSPFFLATLFVPLPAQLVAMAGLKIFASLLFGYLFLKREKISDGAACFGATAFALSVYQTVYLHYSAATVSALLPAAAFAYARVAATRRKADFVLAALVVATLLAGGHPESVLHVAIGVVIVLAIDLATRTASWRKAVTGFVRAAMAALAGLAVSAPTWVPVLEQVRISSRLAAIRAGWDPTFSMPFDAAWTLLSPDLFGNPARGDWAGAMNYSIIASSYVGLLVLGLAVASLLSPKWRDRLFALAAVVVFLVALDWSPIARLVNAIPPFHLAAGDKLRFVSVFFASVAAGRAVDRIRHGAWRWAFGASGFIAVLGAWALLVRRTELLEGYLFAGVVAVLLFWVGAGFAMRFRNAAVIPWVALTVICLELAVLNVPFNASAHRRYFIPQLPIVDHLRSIAPEEPYRILGFDWVLLPNNSAQYGLEDIRGSDPMGWAEYTTLLEQFGVREPGTDVTRIQDVANPVIDFLNVRYLLLEPGLDPGGGWRLVYEGPDGRLYENEEALPRFFAPRRLRLDAEEPFRISTVDDFAEVAAVRNLPETASGINGRIRSIWTRQMHPQRFRMTIDAEGTTFIASSQPAMPGWRVRVNGRKTPIHRVNGAFIGFFVTPGTSRIVVDYFPWSFWGSVPLSLAAMGLLWVCSGRRSSSSASGTRDG